LLKAYFLNFSQSERSNAQTLPSLAELEGYKCKFVPFSPLFPKLLCSRVPFGFEKQPRMLTTYSRKYSVRMASVKSYICVSELILDRCIACVTMHYMIWT